MRDWLSSGNGLRVNSTVSETRNRFPQWIDDAVHGLIYNGYAWQQALGQVGGVQRD